ncbi:MAG TPA: outer membrane beta-barrel protein [Gemmatimonadaceae bacterium]
MMLRIAVLLALAVAVAAPTSVRAQTASPATAWQIRFSIGDGLAGPGSVVDTDRHTGPAMTLGAEHPIVPRLNAIAELTRWQSAGAGSSSATFATASVALYPAEGVDAYVRAGFGYGSASLHAPVIADNGSGYSVSGPAFQVGAGYDYRVTERWSVGAFVAGTNTIGGSAKHKVHHGTGEADLTSFGLSLVLRP